MAEITLEKLTKKFGSQTAVKDVSLKINDGEFLVIVGSSGSGKSTLLELIAGTQEPTSGRIFMEGVPVNGTLPQRRDVAMVFQGYALYPHMTVYENLLFPLKMRKTKKPESERRVKTTAELLNIQHLLHRKPHQLSGGQKQRVALGRAIIRIDNQTGSKPKAILMDEPLSNLDAELRMQTRREILKLHDFLGVTTVYVTHDQIEAMTLADRIVVMKEGEVFGPFTPYEIYNRPENIFIAGFIGSYTMNFVEMDVVSVEGRLLLKNHAMHISLHDDQQQRLKSGMSKVVIVGIKAEDISWIKFPLHTENNTGLNGDVIAVEYLGADSIMFVSAQGYEIRVKKMNHEDVKKGDKVFLEFNPKKILVFDKNSGLNILS